MPTLISSLDNPLIKRLRRLHEARHRREDGVFLVEGLRAITGFLARGWQPHELLLLQDAELPPTWDERLVTRIAPAIATKLSQASTASGYLASFRIAEPPPLERSAGGLVLCGISDPGNLGTLIRCASAFAIRQVVLIGGTDPYAHKVVQASAGELASIALHRFEAEHGFAALADGAPCCALVVRGGSDPAALPRQPRWLVIGSEAHGLDPTQLAACSEQLTLPMPGGAESLNAAMAGAIACYALFAERRG